MTRVLNGTASAALGAALALLLAGPASAGQDETDLSFLVRPAADSSTAEHGGYFVLDAEPGEEVRQGLELRNDSSEPIELQLAAVDATTGQVGGISFELAGDDVRGTATWITLDQTSVVLDPEASARIEFTVRIPADARSGEHLAGLSVQAAEAGEVQDVETEGGEGGASVVVHTRRVIAVQVNLPGPTEPELVVNGVRAVASPQGLVLEVDIENAGTALTKGEGTITVPDGDLRHEFQIDTFLPGTTIAYPIRWTVEPRQGSYDAAVEVRYEGRTAAWSGEVAVGDEVLDDLADRRDDPAAVDRWATLWPWMAAGLAAVVFGTALALTLRRRRRSRGRIGRRRAGPRDRVDAGRHRG